MGGAVKKVGGVVKGVTNTVRGALHGDIKSIISIAAMVVAPYAAVQIGSAMGLSGAVGGAVGGAIWGGATAKLTGGKIGSGVVMGGIAGGIAGYASALKAGTGPWGIEAIDNAGGLGNYLSDTFQGLEAGTTLTEKMAQNIANPYGMSIQELADVNKLENLGLDTTDAISKVTRYGTAENAIAAMKNAGFAIGEAAQGLNAVPASVGLSDFNANITGVDPATGAAIGASPMTPGMALESSIGATGVMKAAEAGGLPAGSTAAQVAAASAPASWSGAWDKISSGNILGGIGEGVKKIGDVTGFNSLSDGTQKALMLGGGALLAAKLGNGFAQPKMTDAQYDYLNNLTEMQKEAYENKKDAAYDIMGEADYYNPDYFGKQAENEAWIKGMSNKNAALREAAGQGRTYATDAEARRFNLGTAKNASLAYTAGADAAQNQRVRTKVSGAQILPNAPSDISGSYASAADNASDASKTYFDIFNRVYGTARSTDDDRKKAQDALGYAVA